MRVFPYRVDAALQGSVHGGPWTEVYEVRARKGDKLMCTCPTLSDAHRICRALNMGDAYGKGNHVRRTQRPDRCRN